MLGEALLMLGVYKQNIFMFDLGIKTQFLTLLLNQHSAVKQLVDVFVLFCL